MIGSFSWNAILTAYWLTSAFWYSSLILSILGIILSAQQVAVLQLLGQPLSRGNDTLNSKADVRRYLPLMLTQVSQQTLNVESLDDGDVLGE